jgi:ketosteroid isomerase-like protein
VTTDGPEARRATIRRLFAAISAGDFDAAVALYANDAPTYAFPPALGLAPCVGKAAIRRLYEQMAARFVRPLQFVPRHIVVEGDVGVIEWEHTATTRAGSAYMDSAPVTRLNQLERGTPQ